MQASATESAATGDIENLQALADSSPATRRLAHVQASAAKNAATSDFKVLQAKANSRPTKTRFDVLQASASVAAPPRALFQSSARRIASPLTQGLPTPRSGNLASGAGAPMEAPLQREMEAAFDADFSDVRIHRDSRAQDIGAKAFARGRDIHLSFAGG